MKELIEAYLIHTRHHMMSSDLVRCDVSRSSKDVNEQCYDILAWRDGQLNGDEVTVTELLEFMWSKIK